MSISVFKYAISNKYISSITDDLVWYEQKSSIRETGSYLITAEFIPPSEYRFISCTKIDTNLFMKGYKSLSEYMNDSLVYTHKVDMIPPKNGTASVPVAGISSDTMGGSYMIRESKIEKLQLTYRGEWFKYFIEFFTTTYDGTNMIVDIDPDDTDYHQMLEFNMKVDITKQEVVEVDSKDTRHGIHILYGTNLDIIKRIFEKLKETGGGGHSFIYKISLSSDPKPVKLYFDGDGSDAILRIDYGSTTINEAIKPTTKILLRDLSPATRKLMDTKSVLNDINTGKFDNWFFNPARSASSDMSFTSTATDTEAYALRKIIVDLTRNLNTTNADEIFRYFGTLLTCPKTWIERYFRSIAQIENIEVSLNFGLNHIEFLK